MDPFWPRAVKRYEHVVWLEQHLLNQLRGYGLEELINLTQQTTGTKRTYTLGQIRDPMGYRDI